MVGYNEVINIYIIHNQYQEYRSLHSVHPFHPAPVCVISPAKKQALLNTTRSGPGLPVFSLVSFQLQRVKQLTSNISRAIDQWELPVWPLDVSKVEIRVRKCLRILALVNSHGLILVITARN